MTQKAEGVAASIEELKKQWARFVNDTPADDWSAEHVPLFTPFTVERFLEALPSVVATSQNIENKEKK